MSQAPLRMMGAPGSPYSRKLRAALRYRQIPYTWESRGWPENADFPDPKVQLLPQLVMPDAQGAPQAVVDTTPMLRRLEREYTARPIVPADPALAFIDALIEDYADEWLTKCMFHYRWAFAPDIARASSILPRWSATNAPEDFMQKMGERFGQRQIERLWVVGSNPETAPTIESSYTRLLDLLDAHLTTHRFTLGGRPATCDFGLYGQLTQLVGFDPTSMEIAFERAPRVVAWVDGVEDLSGVSAGDDDWLDPADLPDTLKALLREIGRVYVPFLIANAEALTNGADKVSCEIDGRPYTQQPFPYQGKCLEWLRADHAALAPEARETVAAALAGSGCEALFEG